MYTKRARNWIVMDESGAKLTPDLWFEIAVHLDKEGIKALSCAYKWFWDAVVNGYPGFWKSLVLRKLAMFDPNRPDLPDYDWKKFFLSQPNTRLFEPLLWNMGELVRLCAIWLENPICLSTYPATAAVLPWEVISNYPNFVLDLPHPIYPGPWIVEYFQEGSCYQCNNFHCNERCMVVHFSHARHWNSDKPNRYLELLATGPWKTEIHKVEEMNISLNVLRRGGSIGGNDILRVSANNIPLEGIISPQGCRFSLQKGPGTFQFQYYYGLCVKNCYVTMFIRIKRTHPRLPWNFEYGQFMGF